MPNTMQIAFAGTALTVKINGQVVYDAPNAGLALGQLVVQSHWGSGGLFSKMGVVPDDQQESGYAGKSDTESPFSMTGRDCSDGCRDDGYHCCGVVCG